RRRFAAAAGRRGAGDPRLLPELHAAEGARARLPRADQPGTKRSRPPPFASRRRPTGPSRAAWEGGAAAALAGETMGHPALPRPRAARRLLDRERAGARHQPDGDRRGRDLDRRPGRVRVSPSRDGPPQSQAVAANCTFDAAASKGTSGSPARSWVAE